MAADRIVLKCGTCGHTLKAHDGPFGCLWCRCGHKPDCPCAGCVEARGAAPAAETPPHRCDSSCGPYGGAMAAAETPPPREPCECPCRSHPEGDCECDCSEVEPLRQSLAEARRERDAACKLADDNAQIVRAATDDRDAARAALAALRARVEGLAGLLDARCAALAMWRSTTNEAKGDAYAECVAALRAALSGEG